MASSLVDNMSTDFAPDKFSDEYQEQLRKLIAAKLEQGDTLDTAATFGEEGEDRPTTAEVVDLMEALRRSVEANRAARKTRPSHRRRSRRQEDGGQEVPGEEDGAKKAAAKKATTTKSAKKAS